MPTVRIQNQAFDSGAALNQFIADSPASVGAIASFVGLVRDYVDQDENLSALELHHYPAMTQKVLQQLAEAAISRFALDDVLLIHRYGRLDLQQPIVLVITSCAHRTQAWAAGQFIMDCLKTDAPFWKCEINQAGERRWVHAKTSDQQLRDSW